MEAFAINYQSTCCVIHTSKSVWVEFKQIVKETDVFEVNAVNNFYKCLMINILRINMDV